MRVRTAIGRMTRPCRRLRLYSLLKMRRVLVQCWPMVLQKGHARVSGIFSCVGAREMCTVE